MSAISERKLAHLALCAEGDVEAAHGNLLDQVSLLHEALPELSWEDVDPSVELLGKRLELPVVVTGMTGGAAEAGRINRALAQAAAKLGIGMGVGSQRAMLLDPELGASYRVRDVAPEILLFANIGVVQARESGTAAVADLVGSIEADALCVHLNPAQELVQDEGDRDFRGGLATIRDLVAALPVPVVVKETGCGLAPRTLARLREAGVEHVDVAGSGGTSWTAVEAQRGSARQRALGQALWNWGIPTAASLVFARRAGLATIASGGVRGAADVVNALALGATVAGMALPFLRAWTEDRESGLLEFGARLSDEVRARMLLTGAPDVAALREAPRVVGPALERWIGR